MTTIRPKTSTRGAHCLWLGNEEYYETGCHISTFQFINDYGPEENGFEYCPFCGRPIVVKAKRIKSESNG